MLPRERKGNRHKKRRMKTKQSADDDSDIQANLFSARELEVSQIMLLLQVPLVIEKSFARPFSVGWGTKRKRSDFESNPPGSSVSEPNCCFESPPPATDKVVALSPATPLAFLPSEPEENPKPLKRKSSVKKKKTKLERFVDGLTQERISLNVELENTRDYYSKAKAFDMELKAIKQRTDIELDEGKTETEFTSLKTESSPVRDETRDFLHSMIQDHTQISDMNDQAVHYPSIETSSPSPPNCGSGAIDLSLSPLGIPDLNISVYHSQSLDSAQPLDLSLTFAVRGRQERNQIYEVKNYDVANEPQQNTDFLFCFYNLSSSIRLRSN